MSPFTITLIYLLTSINARVLWVQEDFESSLSASLRAKRSTNTCKAAASLNQCPGDFPPNFCCSPTSTCLSINTGNASIISAICCPNGSDCSVINPINCNETLQDANQFPVSELHSIPPQQLESCGDGCCPKGYTCNNGQCKALHPLSTSATSSSSSASSASNPAASSGGTAVPATASGQPLEGPTTGTHFSPASFAAGFVPGIAIGLIIAAVCIFLCLTRKRKKSEKHTEKTRDTLTDLSTLGPTSHGRSISEPTIDPSSWGARTDFLRGTPPRTVNSNDIVTSSYKVEASGPSPTASRTPGIKALFSRSPFLNQTPSTPPLTQSPMPAHLKRGTLSFTISPIRGLKKQKSMHSLRRQMQEAARYGTTSRDRTGSTETIQVLMTPDQRTMPTDNTPSSSAKYQPPRSEEAWATNNARTQPQQPQARTPYATSSRYPSELPPLSMPAPPPLPTGINGRPEFLDSPYTPTKIQGNGGPSGGLAVPGGDSADLRRDTTFSSMMERAGLRKSDLLMGTKKRVDGRFGW